MKRVISISLLYCLLLMGCGATVHRITQKTEYKNSSSYKVGQSIETSVGVPMLTKEDIYFYEGMIAIKDYQPPKKLGLYTPLIGIGTILEAVGTLDNGDILYTKFNPEDMSWPYYCVIINSSDEPYGDGLCDGGYIRTWDIKPANFLKKEKIYKKGSIRKELIYAGKTKDNIKLTYREYKDDFARQAFYQDLTYDLSESKVIGFRGTKIEVLEATNTSIKFIVKSPME